MNQIQVDPNTVIHNISEQMRQMVVNHAVALAAKDAEIEGLKAEIEQLRKDAVAEMDAEGSEG